MEALIRLINITKIYQMGDIRIRALHSANIEIFPGEMVAVKGPSGSGKSTLMNILGCLDRPTSGQFILSGRDVAGFSANELAGVRNKTIGFVFQGFNLLPRTSAIENVELPLLYSGLPQKAARILAHEALARLGLKDRASHLPNQLSGGQQQRVAIARALVTNPKMILADEPTGNLDTLTSLEVMSVFQELNQNGITIVLITHETDIALYAKRVLSMKDGRISKDEPVSPRDASIDLQEARLQKEREDLSDDDH